MKTMPSIIFVVVIACAYAHAGDPVELPKDVPPVLGTAMASASPTLQDDDYEEWTIQLKVPKVAWKVVGERRPKREWPKFEVEVEEAQLALSMGYFPETPISDDNQNRILDLNGRRLRRDEALKRLKTQTPVIVSVSGDMPDAYYLQCTKADALVVILGFPHHPAPELLPRASEAHSQLPKQK